MKTPNNLIDFSWTWRFYFPSLTSSKGLDPYFRGHILLFAVLMALYFFVRVGSKNWSVLTEVLDSSLPVIMTFCLLCSCAAIHFGKVAAQKCDIRGFRLWIGLGALGGLFFLVLQAYVWKNFIDGNINLTSNPYEVPLFGIIFYIITGFHGIYVIGGVVSLLYLLVKGRKGYYFGKNSGPVQVARSYWYILVFLIWIIVFICLYLL